jgi:CDP-alcohol phosphatidyltransferase
MELHKFLREDSIQLKSRSNFGLPARPCFYRLYGDGWKFGQPFLGFLARSRAAWRWSRMMAEIGVKIVVVKLTAFKWDRRRLFAVLTRTAMAFVGLVRSQCPSRFTARPIIPFTRALSSLHPSAVRPIAPFHPLASFPRNPLRHRPLPPTASSSLLLHRRLSTPAPRKERHENIYTIPNILTFSRILATPIIAYLILVEKPYLATSLLLYAGLTDLIDGWIARRYNLQSVVGTVIDPMADKFLMITLTGALAYTSAMPSSPSPPILIFILVLFGGAYGSLACGDYSGERLWVGYCCNILSLHLSSPAENVHAVLGLFSPLRRSPPNPNLESNPPPIPCRSQICADALLDQYVAAIDLDRSEYNSTDPHSRYHLAYAYSTVP